ncbi:MAG: hypothetical protein JXB30_12575, partial [Anaerolineae bacterium]|nr:hypothetical protein [Anaerolineae bacterium]
SCPGMVATTPSVVASCPGMVATTPSVVASRPWPARVCQSSALSPELACNFKRTGFSGYIPIP